MTGLLYFPSYVCNYCLFIHLAIFLEIGYLVTIVHKVSSNLSLAIVPSSIAFTREKRLQSIRIIWSWFNFSWFNPQVDRNHRTFIDPISLLKLGLLRLMLLCLGLFFWYFKKIIGFNTRPTDLGLGCVFTQNFEIQVDMVNLMLFSNHRSNHDFLAL